MIKELGKTFINIASIIARIFFVIGIIGSIIMILFFKDNKMMLVSGIIYIILSIILFQLCNPNFWKKVKARKQKQEE